MDIIPNARNTQGTIKGAYEAQEKEDQNVNTFIFLRRGNQIPTGGNTETKCGVATEEKAIQGPPQLGIHPIHSCQTQTLIWMPTMAC